MSAPAGPQPRMHATHTVLNDTTTLRDPRCYAVVVGKTRGSIMEQILINLVAGALGGNAAGKASPTFDLGTIGNTIAGLVGGGVLGQIITMAWPTVAASIQSGNFDVGSIVTQVVGGGAGGAILTAIIGAIKNRSAA